MATYLVLSARSGPDKDPEALFVRDGFSVLAAVFPVFWLLWHRMWFWALGLFAAFMIASAFALTPAMEALLGFAALGAGLLIGLEGQQALITSLVKRGFTLQSVVTAPDLETAERIYFQDAVMVFKPTSSLSAPTSTLPKSGHGVGIFDSYGGI